MGRVDRDKSLVFCSQHSGDRKKETTLSSRPILLPVMKWGNRKKIRVEKKKKNIIGKKNWRRVTKKKKKKGSRRLHLQCKRREWGLKKSRKGTETENNLQSRSKTKERALKRSIGQSKRELKKLFEIKKKDV